jgi:hypothetical protein
MRKRSSAIWVAALVSGMFLVSMVSCQKKEEIGKTDQSLKEEGQTEVKPPEESILSEKPEEEKESEAFFDEFILPPVKAKTEFKLSKVPLRGGTADLTFSITPEEDLPIVRVHFLLMGAELVSGNLTKPEKRITYTSAKANQKTEIPLRIRFVGDRVWLKASAVRVLSRHDPDNPGMEVGRFIEVHHHDFDYYFDDSFKRYVTWGEFIAKPWIKFNPLWGDTEIVVDDGISQMNLMWIDKMRNFSADITAWEALYLLYDILNSPYITKKGGSYLYPPKEGKPYPVDENWAKELLEKGWLEKFRETGGENLLKKLPKTPFPPQSARDWSKEHPDKQEGQKESKKDGSFLIPPKEERKPTETNLTSQVPTPTQCYGTFLYKKYPHTSNYGLDSIPYDVPVRQAMIAIWGYSGTNTTRRILGRDFTDEIGNFDFYVDVDPSESNWRLYPVVYAMGPNETNANLAAIKVSDPTPPAPHIGNAPEDSSVYHDVGNLHINVPPGVPQYFDTTYFDPNVPSLRQPFSGSINIYNALLQGFDYIVPTYTNADTLGKSVAVWEPDYQHASAYNPNGDTIFINGDTSSIFKNTDEWDDHVIIHEYGHHVMHNVAILPPGSGGTAWWFGDTTNFRSSYSEGWADFFSQEITDDTLILDARFGIGGDVGNFYNIENPWIGFEFDTTMFDGGPGCRGAVAGSFWDIYEGLDEFPFHSYPLLPEFPDTGLNDTINLGFDEIWYIFADSSMGVHPYQWTILDFIADWRSPKYSFDHDYGMNEILVHHRIDYQSFQSGSPRENKINVEPGRKNVKMDWRSPDTLLTSQVLPQPIQYGIYRKNPVDSNFTKIAQVSDTVHYDSTVVKGRAYSYTITAIDTLGVESDTSNNITTWIPGSSNDLATAYNNGRKLVMVDTSGTIFVTLTSGDSVLCGWTANRDSTWHKDFVGIGKSPSISMNTANVPWIFWIGTPDRIIYYSYFSGGTWSFPGILYQFPSDEHLYSLSALIGSSGHANMVVDGGCNIPLAGNRACRFNYYLRFNTSTLSVWVYKIRETLYESPTLQHSCVTSDSLNNPHIVWDERQSGDWGIIYYLTGTATGDSISNWTPPVPISNTMVSSAYPFLDEFNGRLDVVWQGIDSGNLNVYHRFKSGINWDTTIHNVSNTSLDLSQYPVITAGTYAVWVEGTDISYSRFDGSTWDTLIAIRDTQERSNHCHALFSEIPDTNLIVAWTEGDSGSSTTEPNSIELEFKDNVYLGLPMLKYYVNGGKLNPSPYTLQREGYRRWGAESSRTIDFHPENLTYQFGDLDPKMRYIMKTVFYYEKDPDVLVSDASTSIPSLHTTSSEYLNAQEYTERNIKLFQQEEKLRNHKPETDNLSQMRDPWEMEFEIDGYHLESIKLKPGQPLALTQAIPKETYSDGKIITTIIRKSGNYSLLAELFIYEDNGKVLISNKKPQNLPKTFSLRQNYPNPFRGKTTIQYQLPFDSQVSLKIYNIAGQQVKTIREGNQKVGYYSVNWDGKDRDGKAVSSGIYFYRFVAQNLKSDSQEYSATRKIVFFK